MRHSILVVMLVAGPWLLSAQCEPEKMIRIVVRDASPGIPEGHFAREPKTMYRYGAKYARLEEAPDKAHKIHGLMITSQPDSWLVNLEDKTGQHVVDPDPNGKVHIIVFHGIEMPDKFPAEFGKLEYGCELAFFASFGSPAETLKTQDGDFIKQAVGIGEWMVVLLRKSTKSPPSVLFLFHNNEIHSVIEYLEFSEIEKIDMKLFAKPEGITIKN